MISYKIKRKQKKEKGRGKGRRRRRASREREGGKIRPSFVTKDISENSIDAERAEKSAEKVEGPTSSKTAGTHASEVIISFHLSFRFFSPRSLPFSIL